MRNGVLRSLVLGLSLASIASAQLPKSAGAPEVSADRTLGEALQVAGENASEMKHAVERMDSRPKRDAMEFLIRYMPKHDLVALDAEFLVGQVEDAFAARATHAWATEVPTEIFYNDVLPYVVLNEKRENWRTDFRQRFGLMVKDAKTLREAVIIVNKAIKDEVKVDYSTKREKADQSPSESMKSGMASCTGLSILLCDALRSVGIPARVAGTPSWTTKQGNHNWVEFYDPATENWHFTDYYPDSKGVDHGWLIADAAQGVQGDFAHAIYASSWMPTGRCFPLVWDMEINYVNAVDVTERYIAYGKRDGVGIPKGMCELRVEYFDDAGNRKSVGALVAYETQPDGVLDLSDQKAVKGVTPDEHADANEFLSLVVPQKGSYLVFFKEKESDRLLGAIHVENEKGKKWVRVSGGKPSKE